MSIFFVLNDGTKVRAFIIRRKGSRGGAYYVRPVSILDVVAVVAELTGIDEETMLELIIRDHKRLAAFKTLAETV